MSRRALAFLWITALALSPAGALAEDLWRFAHPDAKAIIGINWARLRPSKLGTLLAERIAASPGEIPGLEFLDEIEEVLISSPGSDAETEPPMLITLRGQFNLEKIRRALLSHGAKQQRFPAFSMYRLQTGANRNFGFVLKDARTILAGDVASLAHAAEGRENAVENSNALLTRAQAMQLRYDAWAVVSAPQAVSGGRLMSMFLGHASGESTNGFEAGLSVRDGLQLDIRIMTEAEASAKRLGSELGKILKLAAKDRAGDPGFAELEKKIKIAAEGPDVRLTLRLSPIELEKNARLFRAPRPEPKPALAAAPPPPPPPAAMIRIEGLDEGTREIPLPP
jgi:hypothetical protein